MLDFLVERMKGSVDMMTFFRTVFLKMWSIDCYCDYLLPVYDKIRTEMERKSLETLIENLSLFQDQSA